MGHKKTLKGLLLLAILTLIMMVSYSDEAQASSSVFKLDSKAYVCDGNTYTAALAPYAQDNRVYMPIRDLAYALGITEDNIIWNQASQTVTLIKNGRYVKVKLGSSDLFIGSARISMDVPVSARNNYTTLPASWIAKAFGANATWNSNTQSIVISYRSSDSLTATGDDKGTLPAVLTETGDEPIPAYEWDYKQQHWQWDPKYQADIITDLIAWYRSIPHPHHSQMDYLNTYCINTSDKEKELLAELAKSLKEGAEEAGYDEWDTVSYVIAFVQSFTYVEDSVSSGFDEYPRYPLETLFVREGDCEDTAILTATLVRELGYGTALLFFDDHCAVGIKGDSAISGTYYQVNGDRYYYLETTAKGWEIGELPEDRKNLKAIVLPLP